MSHKLIYSTIFTLILFFFLYSAPEFSKNPVQLNCGIGLDGHCTNPEFIDLDNDGDFDIIFERDDDLNYPVYFKNIGSNKSPDFERNNDMFLWLSGIDYGRLRILDLDQDEDYDLIIITYNWFYLSIDTSFVIVFINNGTPQIPVWYQNPDTIYTSPGEILDYDQINILNDTLPQVIISTENENVFGAKLFIQKNDSLIEIPDYFPDNYDGGITGLEFLPIKNDSRFYLLYNYRATNMSVAGYTYHTNYYINTGTNISPEWELRTQWSGQYRLIHQLSSTDKFHLYYQEYQYWGNAVCGIYRVLRINSLGNPEFVYSQFWHQGSIDDLASFDYKKDTKMDLIIMYSAEWEPDPNFVYSSLHVFQCIFDLDSCIKSGKVNFDTTFSTPILYTCGGGTKFDYTDIDNDNDSDQLFYDRSDAVNAGFSRLYINTNNDSFPNWNIYYKLPYDYPNNFPVEAMYSYVDIDLDKDKDLIIEYYLGESRNHLGFLKNIGTPENFIFSDSIYNLLDFAGHPAFADLDEDEDPDIILNYWEKTQWTFKYFQNDSKNDSIIFTKIDSVLPKISVYASCLMDANGDGDYDLVVSTYSSGLYFIENISPLKINNTDIYFSQIFKLLQNYPNPFNSITTITFKIPLAARIKISLYDILGEEVRILYSGFISSGIHHVELDGIDLSSGLYFYVLKSGGVTLVQKCLLIK